MTRGALAIAVLAAAFLSGACSSVQTEAEVPHPYRVVLLPIDGARAALSEASNAGGLQIAVSAEELATRIAEDFVAAHVFSDVILLDRADVPAGVDPVPAAAVVARELDADLILRIHVQSARLEDLGSNGSTLWSSFLWFMLPAPTWFVDDRTYETELAVRAELFAPDDLVKPTASLVAASGQQSLDLWDRGLSIYVPVVPPPYLTGDPETVSEVLTERAIAELTKALVAEFRRREIPTRFDLHVSSDDQSLQIEAASRRRLRRLEIREGDTVLATWVENDLLPDGESTAEQFVYRRQITLRERPGTYYVRVLADDEVGGREVRTLLLGPGADLDATDR